MTVPWRLVESVIRALASIIQSAIGTLTSGVTHLGYFLCSSVHRCFTSTNHDSPRFTFRTNGRLWAEQVEMECQTSLVQGHVVASNVHVSGVNTVSLNSLSVDLANDEGLVFECSLSMEQLVMDLDYLLSGRLAAFSVVDYRGHLNILLRQMRLGIRLVGRLKMIEDKEFIHLHALKLSPIIPFIQFEFSDIGVPRTEEDVFRVTLNNILWQRLYDVLFLYVEREIGKLVIQFVNQFTLRVPFNEIFVLPR